MDVTARSFDRLVTEFYEVWFRYHPGAALEAGVSGYEGGLPAVDDDDMGALGGWLENTIVALEELDYRALDGDRQLDLRLLFGACQDEHQALLEQDWRHRDPVAFLPFRSLHQLLLTPQEDLRGALDSSLSRIPEFMRHARGQLSGLPQLVPQLWVETACQEIQAGVAYLRQVADGPLLQRLSGNPAELARLCDQAIDAVEGFRHFLQQEIAPQATGSVACGERRYRRLFHLRHDLRAEPETMLQIARERYAEIERQLARLSREQTGRSDLTAWLDAMPGRSVLEGEEMLAFARSESRLLRSFLQQGLFDIPSAAQLKIHSPPGCYHHGSCMPDYVAPAVGDPTLTGHIYLTLKGHSAISRLPEGVKGQCIRLGWAGHHLLAVSAADSPVAGTLVRRLNPSATLSGGWPLYAEELLHERGFTAAPEQALIRLLEQLRCCQLALLDGEVHLHGLEPAEAQRRLEALPGITPQQAQRELVHLTRHPTQYLAGLMGWGMISELRELLSGQSADFALKRFHRSLLGQGAIAVPLLIQRVFGDELRLQVEQRMGLAPPLG